LLNVNTWQLSRDIWKECVKNLEMYSVSQKNPPSDFRTFSPNGWEFLVQILHAYCTFQSTLDYKFLFSYVQLWWSYAVIQRLWSHPTCWRYTNKIIIIIIIIN